MKCARLHLQERSKIKIKTEPSVINKKPRRYCQKRLVNPEHEEDPRWMDIWDRFHCNKSGDEIQNLPDNVQLKQDTDDLVLTVQTLKFEDNIGDKTQVKRPRTSFTYITGGNKHRMFVKQAVTDNENSDEDRSSQMTSYYIDDYVKYLCNNDRSRPTSGKLSILLKEVSGGYDENRDSQHEVFHSEENKKNQNEIKAKKQTSSNNSKKEIKEVTDNAEITENTMITYRKSAKRKSLTISRNQSPETIQVIRVDVVCNYSTNSTVSDCEDIKIGENTLERSVSTMKSNCIANKYRLTNSIKTLEENLSGGSKVTLLCKTFELSDRLTKISSKPKTGLKKHNKALS